MKINTVHSLPQKIPFKFEIIIFAHSSIPVLLNQFSIIQLWDIFAAACFHLNLHSIPSRRGFTLGQLVLSEGISIYQAYQSPLLTGSTRQTDHIK